MPVSVSMLGKGKKNTKSEQKTGTVGKGAGKKITKIIGLGKKKPSTDEQTSSAEEDVPTCGNCDFFFKGLFISKKHGQKLQIGFYG